MNAKLKLPIATPEDFEGNTLMRMRVENVKKVRLIDITFTETITLIGGDNAAGKSSFIDGCEWALGGKDAIDMDPISHGKQSGSIQCDFGDGEKVKLSVLRKILRVGDTDWTSEVIVEIPGHLAPAKIQDFLTKLAGQMSLDPVAFNALSDKERFETLRKFVSTFDFEANQKQRDAAFKRRTEINRDQNREQSAADAISVAEKPPCNEIDEDSIATRLQEAGDHNLKREQRKTNREKAIEAIRLSRAIAERSSDEIIGVSQSAQLTRDKDVSRMQEEITALQLRIATAEAECAATVEREIARINAEAKMALLQADQLQARLDAAEPLPDVIDAAALRDELVAARASNARYTAWKSQTDHKAAYISQPGRLGAEADELTSMIKTMDTAKQTAIREANLPVDGLGFGEGYITLGGVPWEQASEAERIDASTAIAMALNPRLKVVLIRNGSALGKRIRERIRQRAMEKGYRILMEVVEEAGSSVVIEDGLVKTYLGEHDEKR